MCPCKRNPEKASVKARQANAAEYPFQSFYWVAPNKRGRTWRIYGGKSTYFSSLYLSAFIYVTGWSRASLFNLFSLCCRWFSRTFRSFR